MATTQWFVRVNGQEHGPIPAETLKQLALKGRITPDTPVKLGASGNWVAAGHVKGLFPPAAANRAASPMATSTPWSEPPTPASTVPPPVSSATSSREQARPASYPQPYPRLPSGVHPQQPPMPPQDGVGVLDPLAAPLHNMVLSGSAQDQLIQIADGIQHLQEYAKLARRQQIRSLSRQWMVHFQLLYLAASRRLRPIPDSILSWRWAGVLIASTAIGGILFVVTLLWAVAICGFGLAAATLYCLLYLPSDSKLADITERLQSEGIELTSQRNSARGRVTQVSTKLSELQQRHCVISAELADAERRHQLMTQPQAAQQVLIPQATQQIVIHYHGPPKSVAVAFLLAFFFGPLGMLYSTVVGAIIMLIISLIAAFLTCGFSLLVTHPICCIWAVVAASMSD